MRCLGIAPPSRMLATRFCILSTPVSSKAKERRKKVKKFIESMMRFRKMKDILRRMSVLSVLKFGFARRGGRNRCIKVPAKVMLVSWASFAVYSYGRNM